MVSYAHYGLEDSNMLVVFGILAVELHILDRAIHHISASVLRMPLFFKPYIEFVYDVTSLFI